MKKLKTAWEKFIKTKFCRTLKEYAGLDDLIAVIITLIGALFYYKNGFIPYHEGWHAFYERIHVELIGIGITVLILGNANQYIQIRQEKRRLILQMGSPDNAFAIEAVRELQIRYWLYDGSTNKKLFHGANLFEADLHNVFLKKSILALANLENSNLRMAHLEGATLLQANLRGAHLTMSHLNNADLRRAILSEAHLEGVDLSYAYLEQAILLDANLNSANLKFADLVDVDLRRASLINTYLQGTNLLGADLTNADLRGVKYDNTTQWPDGFDLEAAGCILIEDE